MIHLFEQIDTIIQTEMDCYKLLSKNPQNKELAKRSLDNIRWFKDFKTKLELKLKGI